MPSATPASSTREPATPQAAPAPPAAAALQLAQAQQLAAASRALWAATLSLMTAYMQTPAPAHRYLLARRIARNFDTLASQDCFDGGSRASFARLAGKWQATCSQFAPDREAASGRVRGLLRFLF